VCIDKLAVGQGCSLDAQCAQGFCVEGFCCESACDGQCTSCGLPGRLGKCVPVAGAPRGGREPCQGEGPCAAQCDGTLNGSCVYPQEEVFCGVGACSDGVASGLAVCSGAGSCLAPTKVDCFPYQCNGPACFVKCGNDDECQPGFHCDGDSCAPDMTMSGDGGAGGVPPAMEGGAAGAPAVVPPGEGGASGGAPGEMPPSAAGEPNEMPPGAAGMPDGTAGSGGSKDSDGCGCRVPAGPSRSLPLVASVLLGLLLRRRRARTQLRDAA
jgi:MYXO-CTERM domain-containing protein